MATLKKIGLAKGRHFRDEIERSENSDYMYEDIKYLIDGFDIDEKISTLKRLLIELKKDPDLSFGLIEDIGQATLN